VLLSGLEPTNTLRKKEMSTTTYAVSPGWKLLMLDMGMSPERVLRRAQLPADLFSQVPFRLSSEHYYALWQGMADEAGERSLPVLVAQTMSVEVLEPPFLAAVCSQDLIQAASRIAEYKPLVGPLRLRVEQTSEHFQVVMKWPQGQEPPEAFGYTELLFWVALARLCTRTRVQPFAVTAPVVPTQQQAIQEYLGIPLTHGSEWAVTVSAFDAARPFLTENKILWKFVEPELHTRLSELKMGASMQERLRAVLIETLPAGDISMEVVARKLALSKRTLQRKLSLEDTTFQEILNTTRKSLALHYLKKSHFSSSEISYLLGYEDPNSFYRAFSSWTGQTPETVRTQRAE
jgi:AraC-like DNA-binding protein